MCMHNRTITTCFKCNINYLKLCDYTLYFTLIEGEPQLGGGGPAYKPQEDYYDEVIELKKVSIPVIIMKMGVMLIAD